MHIFLDEEHPCVLINDSYSMQRQEQITTSETVKSVSVMRSSQLLFIFVLHELGYIF